VVRPCTTTKASASPSSRAGGGRAPELDDPEVLGWLGRFLGRIHAVGATQPFSHRPTLDIRSFGDAPRDTLLASPFLPPELRDTWLSVVDQALDGVRRCFEHAGSVPQIRDGFPLF
jgi:Ser/Thr protein kinase RdoA (MazF antagonist)